MHNKNGPQFCYTVAYNFWINTRVQLRSDDRSLGEAAFSRKGSVPGTSNRSERASSKSKATIQLCFLASTAECSWQVLISGERVEIFNGARHKSCRVPETVHCFCRFHLHGMARLAFIVLPRILCRGFHRHPLKNDPRFSLSSLFIRRGRLKSKLQISSVDFRLELPQKIER